MVPVTGRSTVSPLSVYTAPACAPLATVAVIAIFVLPSPSRQPVSLLTHFVPDFIGMQCGISSTSITGSGRTWCRMPMRPVLACFTRVEEPPSIFVSVMSDEPGSVGITAVLPRASFATSDATAEFIASVIQYQPPSCRPRTSNLPPFAAVQARPLPPPRYTATKPLFGVASPEVTTPPQLTPKVTSSTPSGSSLVGLTAPLQAHLMGQD